MRYPLEPIEKLARAGRHPHDPKGCEWCPNCVSSREVERMLGLKPSTLRSYRRNGLTEEMADAAAAHLGLTLAIVWPELVPRIERTCGGCTAVFVPTRPQQIHCSAQCGDRVRRRAKATAPDPRPCERCGDVFVPAQRNARFCSQRCYRAAWANERRRTDPEFAERQRGYRRRYYVECRDYELARARERTRRQREERAA